MPKKLKTFHVIYTRTLTLEEDIEAESEDAADTIAQEHADGFTPGDYDEDDIDIEIEEEEEHTEVDDD